MSAGSEGGSIRGPELRARGRGDCPLCREALPAARTVTCPGCAATYHGACLDELGGCATLGCAARRERPAAPVADEQARRPRAGVFRTRPAPGVFRERRRRRGRVAVFAIILLPVIAVALDLPVALAAPLAAAALVAAVVLRLRSVRD